jgi:Protein of unknown function (DUF1648)
MTRDWHKWAVLLMWVALPASAWNYWHVWDQLPERMAVHFDPNWQPNGFTSRTGALQLGLGIMLVILLVFTIMTFIAFYLKPAAGIGALILAYVVLVFCWYANYSTVKFNLKTPAHSELVGPEFPALSDSEYLTVSDLHS